MDIIKIKSAACLMMLACAAGVRAQGYTGWDGARSNRDVDVEYVDFNTVSGGATVIGVQRRVNHDMMNYFSSSTEISRGKATSGVGTQSRRRQKTSSPSSSVKWVSKSGEKIYTGTKSNYSSPEHKAWRARRRAQIEAAKEREAERKRQEKIADDKRAAMAEAQANAQLQGVTDRHMQRDRYNATQGAQEALQRAQNASTIRGPQYARQNPKMTAEEKAALLRRQNKPRGVMHTGQQQQAMPYKPAPQRNLARAPRAQIERFPVSDPERVAALRKALAVKAEIRRQDFAERSKTAKYVATSKGSRIALSDHATSSLGRDWTSDDLKPLPMPPAPATRVRRKMTAAEYHNLVVIEMIDQRPLTAAERAYYDNVEISR